MNKRNREYKNGKGKRDNCQHVDLNVIKHTYKGPVKDITIKHYRCRDCSANWNEEA